MGLSLVACHDPGSNGTTPDAPTGDAVPGVGCTARAPRTVDPEVFVGPTGLENRLIAAIGGATTSLDVQMYLFTVDSIADAIIAAHRRGVNVRVLLDPDHEGNNQTRPALVAAGVPTRNVTSLYTFAHAKYLVIDGTTALIMSMNFNYDAMSSERNYGIVDRDPEDVADVAAIFEMDWASGGGEPPKPADLSCTRLIVSPNNSKLRILELINSATATLDVEVLYLSETSVRNAVGAAKARGVSVRVILAESQNEEPDTSIAYLKGLGIPVKIATSFYLHAKLIVADGVAFVGSENMSQTSLTKNREVGALVFEPTPAAIIAQQFTADWNVATPAP
ncbi:MAG: hypothetical protein H0T79_18035 [Deltaproteobacteria bacterium]|nr:hypothetical protein [Deltaproteobacteria bacterium]